jgi:hypothetical protein
VHSATRGFLRAEVRQSPPITGDQGPHDYCPPTISIGGRSPMLIGPGSLHSY